MSETAFSGTPDGDAPLMDIHRAELPVRIGISSCLLGERVRYDGGHKRDDYLVDVVGRYVEWIPVCPEVEAGMGTPRETVHLTRVDGDVRMLTKAGADHTDVMDWFARQRVQSLEQARLSGYILKSRPPPAAWNGCPWSSPRAPRSGTGAGYSPGGSWKPCPTCRWKRNSACRTRGSGRTSSAGFSPATAGCNWPPPA